MIDFSSIHAILNQTNLSSNNPSLYDTINRLINGLVDVQKQISSIVIPTIPAPVVLPPDLPFQDVGFATTNYATNSTGNITPLNTPAAYLYRYKVIQHCMIFQGATSFTINNATTTEIRFKVPIVPGFGMMPGNTSFDFTGSSVGTWNNGGIAGLTGVFPDVLGNYVSVQRWDGIAAAGYPNGATIFIKFIAIIPMISQ